MKFAYSFITSDLHMSAFSKDRRLTTTHTNCEKCVRMVLGLRKGKMLLKIEISGNEESWVERVGRSGDRVLYPSLSHLSLLPSPTTVILYTLGVHRGRNCLGF